MKNRILAFLLCVCLVLSMVPAIAIDTAAASTKTIYFDNSGKNWGTVYVYTWNNNGDCTGGWPGTAMTKVSGSIYSYEVPAAATSIIFNNGNGAQTCDLGVPTSVLNIYTAAENWDVYTPGSSNVDYYLFGYINGKDYGWKDDINTLGYYKFVDGQLTVRFDQASYVAVKTSDNKKFYMTNGYVGESSCETLMEFSDPNAVSANRLYVPGGAPVTMTLTTDSNGDLVLSYTLPPSACSHAQHNADGVCPTCGTTVGHNYSMGVCTVCGVMEDGYIAFDYYLFGYINGANYGCDEDYANLGSYKFENNTLTATFTQNSYIGIKVVNPGSKFGPEIMGWYMTQTYSEDTSATFYNTNTGAGEKLYVPGNTQVTFTLVHNDNGTLSLSYSKSGCSHSFTSTVTAAATCLDAGSKTNTCSKCKYSYTETIAALGHNYKDTVVAPTCENNGYTVHTCQRCGYHHSTDPVNPIGHKYTSVVTKPTCTAKGYTTYTCSNCGNVYTWNETAATGHTYSNGKCTTCGAAGTTEYYLFGYINGADYAIGGDIDNLGKYKFVDGKLTVKFDQTSYVAVKTGDNKSFYMTNGYEGVVTSTLLYKFTDPYAASANKLEIPGGQLVTFTLSENWDGNLILSYTVDASTCIHVSHNTDAICTTCGAVVDHVYSRGVCTICRAQQPNYSPYDYYLFGYINGANYGCEDDSATLGQYKFVNGSLTATFTQDSYIAVKAANPGAKFGAEVVAWYMAASYSTGKSVTLYNTSTGAAEKLFVPGNTPVTFTLVLNNDGSVNLSYTTDICEHTYKATVTTAVTCTTSGTKVHTCTKCSYSYTETIAATGHSYSSGKCISCGIASTGSDDETYYLFGYINGTNYGCEENYANLGSFKFVNGKLTATFTADSYVGVKTSDNMNWYMTNGWQGTEKTSTTLHSASSLGNADKFYIPGNVEITFTLKKNTNGTLTLSYQVGTCAHSYAGGVCTICGASDPNGGNHSTDYYLFGFINGEDYACERDAGNVGEYKFVNGKLTTTFATGSYVAIKSGDNANWYMTDGWQGVADKSVTLYETRSLTNADKFYVPGGLRITFTLVENSDGSLKLSYTTSGTTSSGTSAKPSFALKYPTVSFEDMIVLNVYYAASNIQDVEEMGLITFNSKVSNYNVNTADHVVPGYAWSESDGFYVSSSAGIAAKNLGDTIYFAVYARLKDGTYSYSNLVNYSPKTYAYNQLKSGSKEMQALVVAMLNYGAKAQTYFDYKTDALVNANLTTTQKAMVSGYSASMMNTVALPSDSKQGSMISNGGYASRYPTISFEGVFCINYYFKPSKTPVGNITMYVWDQAAYNAASSLSRGNATKVINMTKTSSDEYVAVVEGIAAKNLDKGVYVAFCYSDGSTEYCSGVVGYSIGTYCTSQASKTGALADLASACAVYGYYAKQLFN